MNRTTRAATLNWDVGVPLTTNRVILRQLALIIVIPAAFVGLLLFVLGVIDGDPEQMKAGVTVFLLVAGILLALVAFATLVVLGNRMDMSFELDEDGIRSLVIDNRAAWARFLAVFLGFLTFTPGLAGAGLLAHSNRGRNTSWEEVKKLEVIKENKTIVLHGKGAIGT